MTTMLIIITTIILLGAIYVAYSIIEFKKFMNEMELGMFKDNTKASSFIKESSKSKLSSPTSILQSVSFCKPLNIRLNIRDV